MQTKTKNPSPDVSGKTPIGKSHSMDDNRGGMLSKGGKNAGNDGKGSDGKQGNAGNPDNSERARNPENAKNAGKSENAPKDSRLEEFFHDEVKDIYWAEKHLVKTLPKMAKAASGKELKDAFNQHLEVTKEHVTRLEKVFELLGQQPKTKKCEAIAGITEEGETIIDDTEEGTATRDAGLILAGQKAEHYEIATYSGLAEIARTLGHEDIAKIMETTLSEEKQADEGLRGLAKNKINAKASQEVE